MAITIIDKYAIFMIIKFDEVNLGNQKHVSMRFYIETHFS